MAQIKVTADVLESKEVEASGLVADHGEAMEQIRLIVYALNEIWKGSAQTAFLREFDEIQPTLIDFRQVLDGYVDLMRQTAKEFRAEDERLASDMGSLPDFV
ncbi:hypothetical protein AN641_01030 [Candidatus Epulonipiscioides gigas]|nr:hypothetical protein AN641_01030 [Epulopiscium sp. SCG-C07WGA-EpuloA2]